MSTSVDSRNLAIACIFWSARRGTSCSPSRDFNRRVLSGERSRLSFDRRDQQKCRPPAVILPIRLFVNRLR